MRTNLILAALCLTGCATYSVLTQEDRESIDRDLSGKDADKYLKLSFYVTPFFGDASKKLLTAVPPEEVRLLNEPSGAPVNPGPAEKIIPAGTRARILKVEFPTAWVVGGRIPYTPRTQPWLYLSVQGEPADQTFILVLRPQLKTRQEFLGEIERYLVTEDPARILNGWSEGVRDAVRTKNAIVDMPADALEMAWGYPELKQISWDQQTKKEKWVWPGEKRIAYLSDGRVTQVEPGP